MRRFRAPFSEAESNASGRDPWTCPSCGALRRERFCPSCGERRPSPHDLTIRVLGEQVFETLTHVDGRLRRTVWDLLFRPGLLASSFTRGVRKTYIAPFQLFLVVNVVFFAVQSLANLNTFSSRLQTIPYQFGSGVGRLIDDRLAALGTTMEAYTPVYNHAAGVNAKSFVILMVLPFAALTWAVLARSARPVGTHVVFALYFYAFILIIACLVSLAEGAVEVVVGQWQSAWDIYFVVPALAWSAGYLFVALRRVYGLSGIPRVLQTTVLIAAQSAIWIGYRFVVFLITLYTTRV